jgi:hypothetical protein
VTLTAGNPSVSGTGDEVAEAQSRRPTRFRMALDPHRAGRSS